MHKYIFMPALLVRVRSFLEVRTIQNRDLGVRRVIVDIADIEFAQEDGEGTGSDDAYNA